MRRHVGKLTGLILFCSLALSLLLPILLPDPVFYIVLCTIILILLSTILVAFAVIANTSRIRLLILSTVVPYCIVLALLISHYSAFRTAARWWFWSRSYKSEVLAQPESATGELKHVQWDGWGFPGAGNTIVYLVFDPADSLSRAAKNRRPGKFNGIPCEVPLVSRMESRWYVVLFYTEESWDLCGASGESTHR
jgi:hypothetical protein